MRHLRRLIFKGAVCLQCVVFENFFNRANETYDVYICRFLIFVLLHCDYFYLKQRSRYRRCSVRKGVFRNFAKLTGKHLCQSLFSKTFFRPATLLKKRLCLAQVFSFEFCEIFKNTFFTEHLQVTAFEIILDKL